MVFAGQHVQVLMVLMVQSASLSGLHMEKKRGEGAPPLTRSVAQMGHGSQNF